MQTQVAEYKQLKDTLNRIPSLRNPERAEPRNISYPQGTPQGYNVREAPTGELKEVRGVAWGPWSVMVPVELSRGEMLSLQPPLPTQQIPTSSYTLTSLVGYVSTQSFQPHLHFPTQLI